MNLIRLLKHFRVAQSNLHGHAKKQALLKTIDAYSHNHHKGHGRKSITLRSQRYTVVKSRKARLLNSDDYISAISNHRGGIILR